MIHALVGMALPLADCLVFPVRTRIATAAPGRRFFEPPSCESRILQQLSEAAFSEASIGLRLDALRVLSTEVCLRARLRQTDEDAAVAELHETIAALHRHLSRRPVFVLKQLRAREQ